MKHKDKRINPATCHECYTYKQSLAQFVYADPNNQYNNVLTQYHKHIAKLHSNRPSKAKVEMGISGNPLHEYSSRYSDRN